MYLCGISELTQCKYKHFWQLNKHFVNYFYHIIGMDIDKRLILKTIKDRKKFRTDAEFARSIGITPQNLAKWYDRNTFDIDKIVNAFPDIDKNWLLTGEEHVIQKQDNIRYWIDVDATAGGVQQFDDMVTDKYISLSIPEFRDCTDAVNLYGDSMVPLYKSGQIIILKEWKESFIDFGNVYLVVTKSGNRMVKYLRKGSDAAHILCVSENKEFDPFEIEKNDILRLYLVKGGISKNTL